MAPGGTAMEEKDGAAMTLCAICHRPVWDQSKPVELGDPVSTLNEPVHGGCARRRTRLERELEASASREGRVPVPSPGALPVRPR